MMRTIEVWHLNCSAHLHMLFVIDSKCSGIDCAAVWRCRFPTSVVLKLFHCDAYRKVCRTCDAV